MFTQCSDQCVLQPKQVRLRTLAVLANIGKIRFECAHQGAQKNITDGLARPLESITGKFLSGSEQINIPENRRLASQKKITINIICRKPIISL